MKGKKELNERMVRFVHRSNYRDVSLFVHVCRANERRVSNRRNTGRGFFFVIHEYTENSTYHDGFV